jgi:hypothetical protein
VYGRAGKQSRPPPIPHPYRLDRSTCRQFAAKHWHGRCAHFFSSLVDIVLRCQTASAVLWPPVGCRKLASCRLCFSPWIRNGVGRNSKLRNYSGTIAGRSTAFRKTIYNMNVSSKHLFGTTVSTITSVIRTTRRLRAIVTIVAAPTTRRMSMAQTCFGRP